MEESNTLSWTATIKQLKREIMLKTKGQYMKESNTLTGNANNNFHGRHVLLNTKGKYMRDFNAQQRISRCNSKNNQKIVQNLLECNLFNNNPFE